MKLFSLSIPLLLGALVILGANDGCSQDQSDQIQNDKQEQLSLQAVQSVGLPSITHFSEKRQLRSIYELRDQAISTVSYIVDLQGHLHKVCDSVGYGIPYATQYTNPQKPLYANSATAMEPQADPNGLYSPASADGTWILCLDPRTKQTLPVYVEPRVLVSPFDLHMN
jgi:hypothetical protein